MRKHRSYPVEFKRQVAQEFLAGETLHGLAKRHEINRNLVRIWVAKYEAGSFQVAPTGARIGVTFDEEKTAVGSCQGCWCANASWHEAELVRRRNRRGDGNPLVIAVI